MGLLNCVVKVTKSDNEFKGSNIQLEATKERRQWRKLFQRNKRKRTPGNKGKRWIFVLKGPKVWDIPQW